MFHVTNCLNLEICRQKSNKKPPKIVNIIVEVLILVLSFHRLKLEIYLVWKNKCLSIKDLSWSTGLHVLAVTPVILEKQVATYRGSKCVWVCVMIHAYKRERKLA